MNMLNLQEFRSTYPQYNDMTDYELSTALHRSKYADMPYEQFARGFGGPLREDERILQAREYNARHPEAPIEPQEEPGFLSKLGNSAMAIGEGLTMLPGGVVDTLRDAYHGGNIDVTDADALRARQEREREQAEYARKYEGKTFDGVTDAMNSMGYSTATMGASLIAGALGSAAGPVGAGAAGMAASGALAYRASKQQFLRQMLDRTEQVLGRMPTQEEWDRIATEFDDEATKFGAWEAGPEALSNLFMAKLLGPLGKGLFRGSVGQGIKRVGGLYGEEFATETATQMGQGAIESDIGLREKAPGFLEAFGEIAPATFWQTTLMAGGKKGADLLARRFRSRKADVEANAGASATGQDDTLQSPDISSSAAQSGEFDALSAPAWNPAEPRMDEDIWNREAAARGWNHLRTDVNAAVTPQDASTSRVSAALEQGESVDLLQSDAAPTPAQRQWAAQTPWESPLAAPFPEASSFTMDAMLRPAVMPARPASNAFLSDAEHADSENFVRKFEEQERLKGDKAMSLYGPMSRMRESYPVSRGVLSQMGQQAMPLAVATANPTAAVPVPTQAQITNTQTAPRADTMAQAEALGMPAPNPLAPGARSGESRVQQTPIAPSNAQSLAPAMDPQPAIRETLVPPPAPMPSFANTQYAGGPAESARAATAAAPQARPSESRAELLQQLSPESRKEARRLTNAQLWERVRAERNPARFNEDGQTEEKPTVPAPQAEPEKKRTRENPENGAFEAEKGVVKSDAQVVENKRDAAENKELSHAPTDAQGSGVDDSGSHEEHGSEDVSRADGKRQTGRSGTDAGGRSGRSVGRTVLGSSDQISQRTAGRHHSGDADADHGLQQRLERGAADGDRVRRGTADRGSGRGRGSVSGLNYNAPVGALARTGSWKETAARNLDIIELSKRLDAEKRAATPEEQTLLAQYVGWGPADIRNKLFPSTNSSLREINPYAVSPDWRPLAERAAELLSPEEVATAFQSTQYAHYTSEPMIRAIWSGLQRLGFKGGNILEPGMGTGLFAVASPSEVMEKSKYTGVEMDKATARIARHLLPESNILNADFVKQKLPDNFFDLAIGNPPFSATKILDDPAYKKYRFLLHDYFFAKSLDKVRPGGLLVFVTSKGTMDKADDKARNFMAERADLLGAIRLPQTVFKQNAGTEVVTDVLFLRKRQPGEAAGGEAWLGRAEVKTPEGPALVNEYFARHPEMVLGEHSLQGSMRRANEYTVLPRGTDIDAQFAEAVTHLPENVYSPDVRSSADFIRRQAAERDFNPKHTKEGALYVDDKGLLRRLDNGSGVDIGTVAKLTDADREWLKGYVELRDALKQAQYDQLQDGDWEASLKKLNQLYDAFVKRHGFINEFKEYERTAKSKNGEEVTTSYRRYKRKRLFDLDVEAPLIEQLEKVTDDGRIIKAEFLKGRTIKRPVTPQIKDINDALMVSLDQRGTLDLDHVAELAGKDRDAVIKELGDAVYEVPGADWQMADEYLSGDVVTKLEEAEAAAASDKRFRRNVEALRKVQPKPLEAKNISVGLGAPWIPTEHLDAFAREILGLNLHIRYNKDSGTFSVPDANRRSARSGTSEWGTPDRSPQEILSAVLNNQSITIRVKDAQGKTRTDNTATTEANEKADKMRKAFESWIWQDAKRTGELVKIYNRTFNNIAPRRFDGSHLTLPGLSLRYKLYDHQKRAIWRIIQTGNVYLAHAVGAGKTLEMIVSGMEQRRLGLIQRPMYVVPNHMLRQFSSEFQDAYPLARIMVADEENFTGDNRRRFVAQAALNAPDAIVITHSAFKRIGTRPETIEAATRDFIAQLEEAIEDSEDRISRSRLEQRLEQAKRRTEARFSKSKDQAVFFEDMGVDFLYVDEAHGFRKLDFVTNRDRVKGIDPSGSEMALDLYSKLEWLRREHPGRSHVLASGTPVTNTMAELYTVMRYMDPEGLERDGLSSFDAWATMFGRVKADLEQNASGSYETVERFAKFVNVPELMKRVRGFMDVLTMSQLGDLVKRPDLKTGQPINVVAQASPAVLDYLKNVLAPRIQASKKWRPSAAEKGNPDPIVRIITDGRLAALDLRFVSDLAEDDPHSKLNLMIDDIIKTHHAVGDRVYTNPETGKADAVKGGTQIVFSSVGFGEQVTARRGFDLRGFMMRRFKEGGIPASQVAWMGDYKTHAKKEAMFKDMRAGKVRVLIGSPQNMGTGVNVQKRLAKLHYLSPPWFPADVEQPHGRILRQGNQNPEVEINWYATKGTYDSTMWGMVARKARFIEQAFTGDDSVRTLEDISESSQYEMAAALAAGDERAIQLAGLNSDIERLSRLNRAHTEEQMRFRNRRRDIEHALEREAQERTKLQTALETLDGENVSADNFRLVIEKETYTKQKEAGEALLTAAERELARWTPRGAKARESIGIGSAQGKCPLILHLDVGETGGKIGKRLRSLEVKIGRLNLEVQDFIRDEASAQGIATRLMNRLNGIERGIRESKTRESELRREQESLQRRIGAPFPQEEELNEKIAEAARIQAELEEEGKKQAETEQQTEEGEDAGGMASLAPGEYLPPRRDTRLRLRHAAAQRVADALGKTAKNAAPVRVVQHFDELPVSIKKKHAGNAAALEGVYDPATGTVWLVADNLSDAGRVAEVWAHEQIVHHGLRGMLSDTERRMVLNHLWLNLGGMGNAAISEVAKRYGLNPRSDNKARLTVMEEVLANLAEKRQAGSLDATEQGAWRKIVNAILRAWNRLVQAVSGRSARMGYGNVDALLADLGRYVMEGVPVGKGGRTGEKAAFASVSEDRETTGRAAWEQVKKDTEAWERQLDDFAAGRGNKIRGLTVGTTPDVLRRLGAKPLPIEMARRNLTKVLAKHEVPLDTLRDLPKHLADPLMVFKSATMSNAYVMLTEMERNGENLVAAIHFDVETGRTRINDIASIHDRSTTRDTGEKVPGWVWIKNQIAAGNLRYYDKTRSSRWFRERAGLQLPSVVNRESYRGVKILTEKDVVKPVAPQEIEEAAHDAWRQIQRDMEEWGRQIDAARNGAIHPRQVLTVGQTPAVLQKLGAPELAMTMTQNVLRKIGEGGKHGLPDALVRRLPVLLAEPVMVFRSGTQANSLVALLETVHSGMPVVAAVHLDVVRGSVHINELSSVYGKSNGGLGWIANEIRAGRRVYADKTKIPAWRRGFAEDQGSRRMSGLQLPGAFVLPNDPRGVKILTEKDVVKPVAPQEIEEGGSPLASLGKAERVPRAYAESIASGVRQIRKVMGRSVGEDVEEILSNPEMGRLVPKNDLSIFERLFKLPHWIAKGIPSFAKLYDRQQRRSEDSMEATNKALAQMPLLFDADAKKRLEEKEYRQLAAMLNKWDGREIGALHGIEKFNTLGKTLWKDRPVLAHNPRYKEKFDEWLKAQPEPERVKQAFRQVRGALDDAFLAAYSKLAAMSDLADTDLETYRTDFGSIHNYFPHSRKGKYFVTATMGKGIAGDPRQVVFRKHFDVPLGSSVREEWAKIVAANRKDFPGATWNQPQKVEKLPDDILGAPIDVEAMEQLIKAAAGKIGDNEQAQEIQKLMLTGISDILKARGFGAHGIKRQNIPGYETENIKEVLYEYISGLNGWLTKMEAASDFAAALGKINAQKTPRLWEYASQYVKDMLRNSDQIDRIAGNIKTVAFAWYLGANFKTAVVNATQNVIIGVPRLQMYVTGGGAQWIKGAMDTIGLKYTGTGVRGARNLTADEESMLQELYGNGVINAAYMDELQGQLTSSPVLKGWRRFIAVLGKPMAMVECFNRASLALAAYRAAKAGAFRASALQEFGLKDGEKMNHEQARDFAAMLVRDSHYEYGKGNQPEFLRSNFAGRMASPVYTFRSFGFNTLNLWWRALRQEGWEGRVFVAKSLGATIALGGLTAFPFYATMAALCAAASGDDEDWTSKIRKAMPESDLMRDVACYGLPALAGVNIGGSLRMETPFTEGIEKGTTFKEAMTESLGALFGIPYDMAVNKTSKFFEAGKYGDGYKMIEALAPTFVANAMQAYRLATEGQTTIKGRPINSPGQPGARKLSGAEAMGKVLGFQPTSSAKSYEAYRAGKRQDAVRSDKVNDLAVLVLKSIDTGNPGGRIAMMQELRAWNKRMQEEGKPHMLIQPKDVLRRVKSRRRENRATPKQRQKGAAQMATWGV